MIDEPRPRFPAAVRADILVFFEMTGVPLITPDGGQWFSQMGVLPIPPCDTTALRRKLLEEYAIEVPLTSQKEQLFVRLSVQGYNSPSEIALLLKAIGESLAKDAP